METWVRTDNEGPLSTHLYRSRGRALKSWESVLIGPQTTLAEAISTMDAGGLRIAVVVDNERQVLGTLTDGDVRRALIRRDDLSTPVCRVMFGTPLTARADTKREQLLALMERQQLLQIPLVDGAGHIVGLETIHGLLHRRHKPNAVFLMAGGFGTRLQPLTDDCPKPLLKVGDKPILELILQAFVEAGFQRFFISTHYKGGMIREHFGDGSRWGASIRYIHEDVPLGTAGALGLLPRDEIREPLLMMNGDLLTKLDFDSLLAFHSTHAPAAATMCVREYEYRVPYGVVEGEGHRIRSMVEKPVHRFFVNAGIYVIAPELLAHVVPGQSIDMPTLLEQRMGRGDAVHMFPIHEYWLDIGRMEDFQRAQFDIGSSIRG
jgi:dTDP-glucose pyrophosphorylase/CBS domain-containing protein